MSRPGTDEFYTVSRREARSKSVGYIPRRGRANSILPQSQIKSVCAFPSNVVVSFVAHGCM